RLARVGEERPGPHLGPHPGGTHYVDPADAHQALRDDLGVEAEPSLLQLSLDVDQAVEIAIAEAGSPVEHGPEDVERQERGLHGPGLTRLLCSGNEKARCRR